MNADPIYLSFQSRGVVTIPSEVRKRLHADRPGAQLRLLETGEGVYEMTVVTPVPADQAWFWTERWQRMEREAGEAIEKGARQVFTDVDSLIADLDAD